MFLIQYLIKLITTVKQTGQKDKEFILILTLQWVTLAY